MNNEEQKSYREVISHYKNAVSEHYYKKKNIDNAFRHLRVRSIDVFRGLLVVFAVFLLNQGFNDNVKPIFRFSTWNGLTYADVVSTLFIMVMGMSIPFYVKKYHEMGETVSEIMGKALYKAITVFLIGILFSALFMSSGGYVRLTGPFQMIAIDYLLGILTYIGLLKLRIKNNMLTYIFITISVIVSFIFTYAGFAGGSMKNSIFNIVDYSLISNFKSVSYSDPYGILSCFASYPAVLMGLSMGCVINKKKIENKRYHKYNRISRIKEQGFSWENLHHDIMSWINPKSLKSLMSNYYRLNNEAKKLVNMVLISFFTYIASRITGIWIPLNVHIFSLSFVLRVTSYMYIIMFLIYVLCELIGVKPLFNLASRIGKNSMFCIIFTTAVFNLFNLIKIKSIYTGQWMGFSSWFTNDFILPFSGMDNAAAYYALIVTAFWVLLSNLLKKYDIKLNI